MEARHVLTLFTSCIPNGLLSSPSTIIDYFLTALKMRAQSFFSISTLIATSVSINLYAARYDGIISTLSLTKTKTSYTLVETSQNTNSSANPSWLQFQPNNKFLFATEENFSSSNGSIASYSRTKNGVLTLLDKKATATGPVNIAFYADSRGAAVAGYASSTIQSFTIDVNSGSLDLLQTFTYTLEKPGKVPDRQERPHPHQVLVDPTGSYVVAPDLGADLLRVYSINRETLQLKEEEALKVRPGSGPRHGVFLETASGCVYYFLVTELSNETIVYRLDYGKSRVKRLSFKEVFRSGTFGSEPVPAGSAAAEVFISVSLYSHLNSHLS